MAAEMNLTWLMVAVVLPVGVALPVCWPFWARGVRDDIGSVAGSAVVLLFTVMHIAREFAHVLASLDRCVAAGRACHFAPEPFTRYAIYAGLGMLQVFLIFLVGLRVGERRRHRPSPARSTGR